MGDDRGKVEKKNWRYEPHKMDWQTMEKSGSTNARERCIHREREIRTRGRGNDLGKR